MFRGSSEVFWTAGPTATRYMVKGIRDDYFVIGCICGDYGLDRFGVRLFPVMHHLIDNKELQATV